MSFRPIPGVALHARKRAIERLGCDPAREEWLAAVEAITARSALLLTRNAGRDHPTDVYLVSLAGQSVQAVWREDLGLLVTVVTIPMGCVRVPQPGAWVPPKPAGRRSRERQPYHRERMKPQEWR